MEPPSLSAPHSGAGTLQSVLNYYLELEDGGINTVYPGSRSEKLRRHEPHLVEIEDMRQSCEDLTLDTCGFQLVEFPSCERSFEIEARVKSGVYAETSELLKRLTAATCVRPFSHIIRRHTQRAAVEAAINAAPDEIIRQMHPANFVHVDQSYRGAQQVFADNIPPEDFQRLNKCRWAIINVWRPIGGAVCRDPLALCDARSVPDSDLRAITAILPQKGKGSFDNVSQGRSFEVWNVAFGTSHRWYYASNMMPDEVLLIKCFDSKIDDRTSRRSPHSAFQFQEQDEDMPARKSIEVRCLVFWEDDATGI